MSNATYENGKFYYRGDVIPPERICSSTNLEMIEDILVIALHENIRNLLPMETYSLIYSNATAAISKWSGRGLPEAIRYLDDVIRKRRREWTLDCLKNEPEAYEGSEINCRLWMRARDMRTNPRVERSWIDPVTGRTGAILPLLKPTATATHRAEIHPRK
jgi:hypothetical protein